MPTNPLPPPTGNEPPKTGTTTVKKPRKKRVKK